MDVQILNCRQAPDRAGYTPVLMYNDVADLSTWGDIHSLISAAKQGTVRNGKSQFKY